MNTNGTQNAVSIDRINLDSTAEKAMQATKVERHDDVPLEARNTRDEYVVVRIVRHKHDHEETKYFVRWYSYKPINDK